MLQGGAPHEDRRSGRAPAAAGWPRAGTSRQTCCRAGEGSPVPARSIRAIPRAWLLHLVLAARELEHGVARNLLGRWIELHVALDVEAQAAIDGVGTFERDVNVHKPRLEVADADFYSAPQRLLIGRGHQAECGNIG